ncbi:MAG: hypothetical protein QXP97_00195 [Desulfurococcus sp.]|jgi:hypothetical protein|uniref:hypothetical protein n=1 Tax=Desulfurococcus sp. TaxID=51678 RepID=UPI00315EDC70
MRKEKTAEYVRSLILKLYDNRDYYFYGDELNSEGWKVFGEIIYHTLKQMPWYRRRIRDLRRKPTYENIFVFTKEAYDVP